MDIEGDNVILVDHIYNRETAFEKKDSVNKNYCL